MNVRRSLVLLMTVICVTVNVAGLVLYARHKSIRESEEWVKHSYEVIFRSQAFYGNMEKTIATQRGYLLSQEPEFLQSYHKALKNMDDDMAHLLSLTDNNPKQNERLHVLDQALKDLRELLDQRIKESRQEVEINENIRDARDMAENIRLQIVAFFNEELRLLEKRQDENERDQSTYFYSLFVASAVSILVLVIANALIMTMAIRHRRISAHLSTTTENLDKVHERLELAMEATEDGVFDWNFATGEIYYSGRFRKMLGYDSTELDNSLEAFDRLLHPDGRARVWDHFNAYRMGEIAEYRDEFRMQHKDGSWRWHLVRGTALHDGNGHPYRFVGAHTDITEAKIAEQRLIASNKELEEFTYLASHDLRSPLVNLRGFAGEIDYTMKVVRDFVDQALPKLNPSNEAEIREAVDSDMPQALGFITGAVEKMERLTRSILELSRVGRRNLRLENVSVQKVVTACLGALQHQIASRNVKVTVGDLPDVRADLVAIEQVFGNLIDNAMKYLDSQRTGEITIGGLVGVSENIYHVQDNGRGIRVEDKKKVFELFKRAGKNSDIPGEGMGLSYVQAILRRHGGAIWLESEPGKGSIFYFSIPHHITKEHLDV